MRHPTRRQATVALSAVSAVVTAGVVSATPAVAGSTPPARHVVSQASPWTAHAGAGSAVPSTAVIHAKVWLSARDASALENLARAVSNPASPSYGHYLSADAYRAQFAPDTAELNAVEQWLTGAGLKVERVGPDNHFVAVAGAAASINAAFGANVRQFSVNGDTVLGPTSSVTAPSGVAASVLAVTGLDTLAHQVTPQSAADDSAPDVPGSNNGHRVTLGPPAGFVNAGPCSSYYGQKTDNSDPAFQGTQLPYAVCGYVPSQLRSAYGVTSTGRTGAGVTVAITDAFSSPTLQKDANTYATAHGDAAFAPHQFSVNGTRGYDPQRVADCGGNGWYGEQTLDVEAVHGMAPAANVAYYGAASCYDDDLMAALAQVVSDDKASLVSNSWGEPSFVKVGDSVYATVDPALIDAYESIFKQGAVQGIGFYFSSGDSGDDLAAWGVKGTDYPTSDPWVTSVGGTALAVDAAGARQFETGWGTDKYHLDAAGTSWVSDGFLYGAGGGVSELFAQPSYQQGVASGNGRGVPDIAMDADPTTGMLVGETQAYAAPNIWGQGTHYGEYRIGGTSLASPLLAGLNADAQQGRSRIGFANPLIYGLADAGVYFDVTPQGDPGNVRVDYINGLNAANGTRPTVRTFDDDASLRTNAGWDDVTGVGAPTASYLHAVSSAG